MKRRRQQFLTLIEIASASKPCRLSDLSHGYESYERMAASPRVFLLWIQRQLPIENFLMRSGAERDADISLATMRYRLRILGGSVDIERAPGGDTILSARLPL